MTGALLSLPPRSPRQPWHNPLFWIVLAIWGLGIATLANAGVLRPPFNRGVPFPLLVAALVPAFLVPVFIILHLIAWQKLREVW